MEYIRSCSQCNKRLVYSNIKNFKAAEKTRSKCRHCGRKIDVNDDYFDTINSESAYILGFLITDGHILKNTKQIKLSLGIVDKLHLEKIRDILSPNRRIYITKKNRGGKTYYGCCLQFTSDKIYDYLKSIGFTHNKTFNPPNLFRIIPEEYCWDYIRGIFDGDGCICLSKRYIGGAFTVVSASRKFLMAIKKYIGFGKIYKKKSKNPLFVYSVTKRDIILDINDKIYKNCSISLERKRRKFIELKIRSEANGPSN